MTKQISEVAADRVRRFDEYVKTLRPEDAWGVNLKAVRASELFDIPLTWAKELIMALVEFEAAR